jgi:hypothetical protein
MDRNEFTLDPRHVGVPSVVPKMISKPMVVRFKPSLSCMEFNTISKQTKMSFHLIHITIGCAQSYARTYGHSAQTINLSCVEINNVSK